MDLLRELSGLLDTERVSARLIDRIAWASDASVYRLVPRAVVHPTSVAEIQALFGFAHRHRIPLTFRAAGTSLSGQAVTDGILVVLSRHWKSARVEDEGRRVSVQPGVIGAEVNRRLRLHGRKIGPDPASIHACMMGGILANNSSGMCCGVAQNAYHTLRSMRFVLPDGRVLDTREADAEARFLREAPALAQGLLALRRRIEENEALAERVRAKYRIKNTMGYSLNAFLDFREPLEILAHLMIGSEGTLGFIAEAVLETVPDPPWKYTGLLFFPDVPLACEAIAPLGSSGARALELMDRASLRAVEHKPGMPDGMRALPRDAAAILVEYQCESPAERDERIRDCHALLPSFPLIGGPSFTCDPDRQAALWKVRKGLIPSVGSMRRAGTSFIIEDIVFPLESLARGVGELQGLFTRHGYEDAIVFGHAKDGNLHFVLTQRFQDAADVERYDAFMRELAVLVVERHGGSLKAEHGTGRNMAPFVLAEWGDDALALMRDLKRLVDPLGILNPGVILNDDPQAHVAHLKPLATVESEVDACIECGFCERICPSRDLTMTPRQRIVVRREMAVLRAANPRDPLLAELERDYRHAGIETCAADGLCAMSCPVEIDTGALVRRLRGRSHSAVAHQLARLAATRFSWVERATRGALAAGHLAQQLVGEGPAATFAAALGIPWRCDVPRPARHGLPRTSRTGAAAIYFPSCMSRIFAGPPGPPDELALPSLLVEVSRRAGLAISIPAGVEQYCCGMVFSSKGYHSAANEALGRTLGALWGWSDGGRLPVVCDSSPCAFTLKRLPAGFPEDQRRLAGRMEILDGVEFAHDSLLPRLEPVPLEGTIALHPVCSLVKLGLEHKLHAVASACASAVWIPPSAGCCGFAGDRGFVVPALTAAATRQEAEEIRCRPDIGHYSSSQPCEIGLSRATGRTYRSFWSLLSRTTCVGGRTACGNRW